MWSGCPEGRPKIGLDVKDNPIFSVALLLTRYGGTHIHTLPLRPGAGESPCKRDVGGHEVQIPALPDSHQLDLQIDRAVRQLFLAQTAQR